MKTPTRSNQVRSLDRPNAPPGSKYPVELLPDGLVSMESTPDYLVEA